MKVAVEEEYTWCASIDLQDFFDEIPHGLILKLLRRRLRDERFITMVARALKAGVSRRAQQKFKRQVRQLTKRNNPLSMHKIMRELNEYVEGWVNYYRIQEFGRVFEKLDRYIRNRLRSMQLKKWKNAKKLQRMLMRAGFAPSIARQTWVKMKRWRSVFRREVLILCDLAWFRRQRLIFLADYTNRNLELQFSC